VPRGVGVQVPSDAPIAPVAQLAEAADSNPAQCWFESDQGHQLSKRLMSASESGLTTRPTHRGVHHLCGYGMVPYGHAKGADLYDPALKRQMSGIKVFLGA
jgi:hypothetical protein